MSFYACVIMAIFVSQINKEAGVAVVSVGGIIYSFLSIISYHKNQALHMTYIELEPDASKEKRQLWLWFYIIFIVVFIYALYKHAIA